jgi:hypothetical protein
MQLDCIGRSIEPNKENFKATAIQSQRNHHNRFPRYVRSWGLSAKKKDKNRSENSQPEIIIIQRQIIFDEDFSEDLQWWYR